MTSYSVGDEITVHVGDRTNGTMDIEGRTGVINDFHTNDYARGRGRKVYIQLHNNGGRWWVYEDQLMIPEEAEARAERMRIEALSEYEEEEV